MILLIVLKRHVLSDGREHFLFGEMVVPSSQREETTTNYEESTENVFKPANSDRAFQSDMLQLKLKTLLSLQNISQGRQSLLFSFCFWTSFSLLSLDNKSEVIRKDLTKSYFHSEYILPYILQNMWNII